MLLNYIWIQLNFVTADASVSLVDSNYLAIRDPDKRWRFAKNFLAWVPLPYYPVSFQYTMCSIVAVLLGLSRPEVLL